MDARTFEESLRSKVDTKYIKVALSMKLSFNSENFENATDCDERICFIIENIELIKLKELVSYLNENEKLYTLIDKYFISHYGECNFLFGFSSKSTKFYVEKYTSKYTNKYIIESYEWENNKPEKLIYRVYNKCSPELAIRKFGKQRILDYTMTKIRISENTDLKENNKIEDIQNYVKFKTDECGLLIIPINIDTVQTIMFYCNNKSLRKWLFKNCHMKLAWLQWSDNSFTVYIRDK